MKNSSILNVTVAMPNGAFKHTVFCAWCGEEAKNEESYHDREVETLYYCECDGAKLEMAAVEEYSVKMEICRKLAVTNGVADKMDKLNYEYEVNQLKRKYHQL